MDSTAGGQARIWRWLFSTSVSHQSNTITKPRYSNHICIITVLVRESENERKRRKKSNGTDIVQGMHYQTNQSQFPTSFIVSPHGHPRSNPWFCIREQSCANIPPRLCSPKHEMSSARFFSSLWHIRGGRINPLDRSFRAIHQSDTSLCTRMSRLIMNSRPSP